MNGAHKNNLKRSLSASNEIAKDQYANTQRSKKKKQRGSKNKLDGKDTENSNVPARYQKDDKRNSEVSQKVQINTNSKTKRKKKNKNILGAQDSSDVPTKYPKDDKRTLKVFQNLPINTNNKTKRKRRNRKRKQDTNLDPANESVVRINDTKEKNKKSQMPAKNLDLEHRETKIEKHKKINEKKMKRISSEVEAQQVKLDKILELNKHKINIKKLEEMLANKSQPKPKVTKLTLRDRMMAQLRASRFRFINEILYNNDSSQSKHYFKTDPDAFMAYHAGYKQQLEQWAVNPLDIIISSIKKLFVYSALFLKEIYTSLNTAMSL